MASHAPTLRSRWIPWTGVLCALLLMAGCGPDDTDPADTGQTRDTRSPQDTRADRDTGDDGSATCEIPVVWHFDPDRDGYGVPGDKTTTACEVPSKLYSNRAGDCDNRDSEVWEELTGYADADGDGFTTGGEQTLCTDGSLPPGFRDAPSGDEDCDDNRADINPDATEVCNELDDDCDNQVDEGDVRPTTWFVDCDGDTFAANTDDSKEQCTKPAPPSGCGNAAASWTDRRPLNQSTTDCDDSVAEAKPTQTGWFDSGYGSTDSFDYDCSGQPEKRWTKTGCRFCSCPSILINGNKTCITSFFDTHWNGTIAPSCGQTGQLAFCNVSADCSRAVRSAKQQCH